MSYCMWYPQSSFRSFETSAFTHPSKSLLTTGPQKGALSLPVPPTLGYTETNLRAQPGEIIGWLILFSLPRVVNLPGFAVRFDLWPGRQD